MSAVILIDVPTQTLTLKSVTGALSQQYTVSTAANGVGEKNGSFCTPRGKHIVRAKIGAGLSHNTVFVGRRPTGEVFEKGLRAEFPNRDWILTRIIWLSGTEVGVNRLRDVDTMRRYVYLHGTPDDVEMGVPGSHGCIRMRNADIVQLFNEVTLGMLVTING
ncbi:MAG: L,D-transpeptidase YbiS [Saprospiraceae bacterium]|jgi:L,D-transpeptidase YbiS